MSEEEIEKIKESLKENELFKQSSSLYKEYQFEQFNANGKILEGQQSRILAINGKETLVIFNFKNGLIHSENNLPAIEYPLHWEYWENGIIKEVVDKGGDTREYWENGIPVRIEHNLEEREQ